MAEWTDHVIGGEIDPVKDHMIVKTIDGETGRLIEDVTTESIIDLIITGECCKVIAIFHFHLTCLSLLQQC